MVATNNCKQRSQNKLLGDKPDQRCTNNEKKKWWAENPSHRYNSRWTKLSDSRALKLGKS